ncbi:carbamoyltransferase C-terminal domain-containing protein [Actinosynnema sp. CS-041913]|uniref:carbamoyltransferase C-terminal domain-containing protein n=1 Tax=Actinosynnema sp. CS-041913 TaxID=3239917 RepID=UPI003D8F0203
MRDGYYLSTYLTVPGLHRVARVSYRHDHNVSLWRKDGPEVRLLAHWELERLSGLKHHRTPFLTESDLRGFLDGLLRPHGVSLADVVETWGTPGLSTVDDYHLVAEHPDIAYHSLGHLYSALLLDSDVFFGGTTLGFAVDGGPDRLVDRRYKRHWFSGALVRRGAVEIFPVASPGLLYSTAKDRFGMREGTLMALATATKAVGHCDREAVLDQVDFTGVASLEHAPAALERIVARVRETADADPEFTEEESLVSAVMKEVQAISVLVMERNVERALARFDLDPAETHLALSGGYALNCPTNSHLMAKYGFRGFLAPPCVDDGGQSIGMGLAAFHKKTAGERFEFSFPGAYLGREDRDLDGALREFAGFVDDVGDIDHDQAVRDILAEPVVWFSGRSEIGPRALGNRSLIADPTSMAAKDTLNRFKLREWWRPVAPVVLEDHLADWFEDSRPSPYMLETFTIRGDRRHLIPAVAHLDHSARVQSVNPGQNPELHALLTAMHRRTGVPMLCNTSLNDKNEPIIDTIREAFNFCLRRRVGVGYFNGRRVAFRNFDAYRADGPYPRAREPFVGFPAERETAVRAEENPHGLPDLYLHVLLLDLTAQDRFDLRTVEGAAAAREAVEHRLREDPGLAEAAERSMARAEHRFTNFGTSQLLGLELDAVRRVAGV